VVRGRAGRTPAQGAAIRLAAPASSQPDLADFADFVKSSQAKMVRLAELLTGDRGRAEDLAQDGYAKAYAAWTRIRGGDPQAYVRRCIVNANTDWWRRRTWREQPRPLVPDQQERADMTAVHAARDVVLRALARLTARERAARCAGSRTPPHIAGSRTKTAGGPPTSRDRGAGASARSCPLSRCIPSAVSPSSGWSLPAPPG
jgi:Sigma-70 region 2